MVRALQFGIVAILPGRVRGDEAAVRAADWVEQLLTPEFFSGAPFRSVSLVLVYGPETSAATEFLPRRGDELPVTLQLDMARLRAMPRPDLEDAFRFVILKVLAEVAKRFDRPSERPEQELAWLATPDR